jgi:hypothetical protein
VYKEILLPAHAPPEYANRSTLWNAVEKSERAKNAQLAREVRLALPNEFFHAQNTNMVCEYVHKNFVSHGMCADICIHDKNDDNIHAHVLLTMRPLEQDGSWGAKSRMEYILDDYGERIKLPSGRYKTKKINTTDWDNRANAEVWRKDWAEIVNRYLENNGHENRVDHRSFERQKIEQIPTIHLGVVAHGLEKRGIATERGNINRSIKAANDKIKAKNAKIQSLNNEIRAIENPPKPQLLIDLENSIKAKESPGYAHWIKIFNLKQAASTLLFIQENGYSDMDSLLSAHQKSKTDVTDIEKQIREISAELKALTVQKEQAEIYRNTLEVYKKYTAPGVLLHFKNQYYKKHTAEIESHKKAKAYIFGDLKLKKFPSLKKLSGDISALSSKEKALRRDLSTAQKKRSSLNIMSRNVRMLLGYKELESQGLNPVAITSAPQTVPVYKATYAESEKAGESAAYFQSLCLNKECAVAIEQAITKSKNNDTDTAVNEVISLYGIERVEWVLAATVGVETSEALSEHKKRASDKKLPAEPIGYYIKAPADLLDKFIQRFKIIAWAKSENNISDKSLSMKERLEVGMLRSKEREQYTPSSKQQRPRRDSGIEM